jgi:transposase
MNKRGQPVKNENIDTRVLIDFLNESPERWEGVKCSALIAMKNGKKVEDICEIVGITRETLRTWRKSFENEGTNGLKLKKRQGRPSKLDLEQQLSLKNALMKTPEELGFQQAIWDGNLVCVYLKKNFNIKLELRAAQNWMKKLGFTRQYPRRKYIKADAAEREKFKKKIRQSFLKK